MTFRLMPALCILVLAGCTSSEPQKASYAPLVEEAAPVPTTMPPPPPAPAVQGQAGQIQTGPFPANGIATAASPQAAPGLEGQGGQFPPGQFPVNGIATAVAPQAALGCHTVDDVTLCDVPADPSVDESHYTN